jgi:Soluble NSF attachment protein, SNAP
MSDADSILAEARKKATAKSFFGGSKLDEAADLFGRAANAYKLKRQCMDIILTKSKNQEMHSWSRVKPWRNSEKEMNLLDVTLTPPKVIKKSFLKVDKLLTLFRGCSCSPTSSCNFN